MCSLGAGKPARKTHHTGRLCPAPRTWRALRPRAEAPTCPAARPRRLPPPLPQPPPRSPAPPSTPRARPKKARAQTTQAPPPLQPPPPPTPPPPSHRRGWRRSLAPRGTRMGTRPQPRETAAKARQQGRRLHRRQKIAAPPIYGMGWVAPASGCAAPQQLVGHPFPAPTTNKTHAPPQRRRKAKAAAGAGSPPLLLPPVPPPVSYNPLAS